MPDCDLLAALQYHHWPLGYSPYSDSLLPSCVPQAACCSDKQHCCPSGSTCTEEGCVVKPRPYWRF